MDLDQLQILAQLADNMEVSADILEKAYDDNDADKFNNSVKEISDIQEKISEMVK